MSADNSNGPSVREIFLQALDKPSGPEREACLSRACGSDSALRAKVESLLNHDRPDGFMGQPAGDVLEATQILAPAPSEKPGDRIGRYKLLEEIGEGGCGVVYMAEQEEPVRRKVALKIIKQGMDTKQVIARFEAERQALALMEHPNIAKVFDAGATETGRPYFVMELVRGIPITRFCDEHRLSTTDRLELFIEVCSAIQHAHQKGIIHRDIKPSNILVTTNDGAPVPKVIDFGIAKATSQLRLTDRTLFTAFAQFIGTPAYMSPEQAVMTSVDIDTRSDIYALGVLLYELLTGETPLDTKKLMESGLDVMCRSIREQEPLRPSTRLRTMTQGDLTTTAKLRHSEPPALIHLLHGDLDCIVMKALEKDRNRRYETALGLAEDVKRHLQHKPILAHTPSFLYSAQKLLRRRRWEFVTAAGLALLLAGLVITALLYWRAANLQWAKGEALPKLVELVKDGDNAAAFALARQARRYLPEDRTLVELWPRIAGKYSIATTPAGAEVRCRDYSATNGSWQYLGRTPLTNITLPQLTYRWKLQKEGFADQECVAGNSIDIRLREKGPGEDMVWIDGWVFSAPAGTNGEGSKISIPAYLIDKYEVTNEKFKRFVAQGGYGNPKFWQGITFIREGRTLNWAEAVGEFRDSTGQPGPSTWANGSYAAEEARHPVSGVSWFEAVAYSAFMGQSLPTVHHWQQAACWDESAVIVPGSRFEGTGPAAVGTSPGMGHTGLCDMAGNVKEWCWNATDESGGYRYTLGGGWGEQTYMFVVKDFRSPWDRSPNNGFRLAQYPGGESSLPPALSRPVSASAGMRDYSTVSPCSDSEYKVIRAQFEYDRTPLNEKVQALNEPSPFWSRKERITFDAAYGGEQMVAYLFLPVSGRPPYQAVVVWPGGSAVGSGPFRDLPQRYFTELILASGRALLFPIYKGTFERSHAKTPDQSSTPIAFQDWGIQCCKDLRRSVDYLQERSDIDRAGLAYCGMSAGGVFGPMALAIEDRFRAGILIVGGLPMDIGTVQLPIIDPLNHAPRVKTATLMINGELDYAFPLKTSQRPLFRSLGTPGRDKKHILYPGGHGMIGLFRKQIQKDIRDWLDRYLGPI